MHILKYVYWSVCIDIYIYIYTEVWLLKYMYWDAHIEVCVLKYMYRNIYIYTYWSMVIEVHVLRCTYWSMCIEVYVPIYMYIELWLLKYMHWEAHIEVYALRSTYWSICTEKHILKYMHWEAHIEVYALKYTKRSRLTEVRVKKFRNRFKIFSPGQDDRFIVRDDTYDDSRCGYDCDDKSISVLAVSLIITLYQIHEIKSHINRITTWFTRHLQCKILIKFKTLVKLHMSLGDN